MLSQLRRKLLSAPLGRVKAWASEAIEDFHWLAEASALAPTPGCRRRMLMLLSLAAIRSGGLSPIRLSDRRLGASWLSQ